MSWRWLEGGNGLATVLTDEIQRLTILYTEYKLLAMVISSNPLGEQVYSELLALLQRGTLPPGSRRSATPPSPTQLGVSRTPVREALLRLAREGVLDADAGRGFRVRPLDRAELRDVGAILAELEPLALRLAGVPADRLERLDEIVKQTGAEPGRDAPGRSSWTRPGTRCCSKAAPTGGCSTSSPPCARYPVATCTPTCARPAG